MSETYPIAIQVGAHTIKVDQLTWLDENLETTLSVPGGFVLGSKQWCLKDELERMCDRTPVFAEQKPRFGVRIPAGAPDRSSDRSISKKSVGLLPGALFFPDAIGRPQRST